MGFQLFHNYSLCNLASSAALADQHWNIHFAWAIRVAEILQRSGDQYLVMLFLWGLLCKVETCAGLVWYYRKILSASDDLQWQRRNTKFSAEKQKLQLLWSQFTPIESYFSVNRKVYVNNWNWASLSVLWPLTYLQVSTLFFYLSATKNLQIVGLSLSKTCLSFTNTGVAFKLVHE